MKKVQKVNAVVIPKREIPNIEEYKKEQSELVAKALQTEEGRQSVKEAITQTIPKDVPSDLLKTINDVIDGKIELTDEIMQEAAKRMSKIRHK